MKGILFVSVAFAFMAAPAMADLVMTYDGPYLANSWYANVGASGIGAFDTVAVRITPPLPGPDTFESPAIQNISNPNWSMLVDEDHLASFTGPSVGSLNWQLYFDGALPSSGPFGLDWAFFNSGQLTAWTHWNMGIAGTYTSWFLRPVDGWQPDHSSVVPVPGALLLGLLGLGVAGARLRKKSA